MALDPKPIELTDNASWNGWVEKASADNDAATATRTAETNKCHYITNVSASFSATKSALLQIKDGSTVIAEHYVYDQATLTFPAPIKCTSGNAVSAVLAASGSGGTLGKVVLSGFTKEA